MQGRFPFVSWCALFLEVSCSAAWAAADFVPVSKEQAVALGIVSTPPVSVKKGEVPGLPGQVVVPNSQVQVVSAPLPALVESLPAAAGEEVRRGQVLARLQSPALAEAQAAFLKMASQAELARENWERDEKLWKEGIIAERRYLASQSRYTEAAAALAQSRQALRLAGMSEAGIEALRSGRAIDSRLPVASPLDGVVLEQLATPGQRVDATAPLYKVARLNPLWVELQVTPAMAAILQKGDEVRIPARGVRGRLIALGKSVAAGSQTVMARAVIEDPRGRLRPGELVEASVGFTNPSAAWSIPNSALVRRQGKIYVFVAVPGGFQARSVSLIAEGAEGSIVGGSFAAAERIAVRGVAALKAAWRGGGE